MVSAKTVVLIAVIVGICYASPVKRGAEKCKPTEEDEKQATESFYACFESIHGRKFDFETLEDDDFSEENTQKLGGCVFVKMGIVSEDGKTFHADVAKEQFNRLNASDEEKQKLIASVDKCEAEAQPGEGWQAAACMTTAAQEICA